ncbi:helix-turn-helix domain-containing protein [Apilactobacillus ozensis]|uniref:helix-turn-helix domain-containing protein n=1 Tax=Apilactobacillus ozensis TaxID=866801 RepID=UPI00200B77E9|nr:helix-turn-helix transcriptional regulator [Apilactobacillus ozensis]MCK8606859.1 helix-turn-helix domain-containing protein [Apilactobacillus ozensis]
MEFGKRIQSERVNNKLTQDEVANKLIVSRQTISSWENERTYPDINSLIKLSNLYHVSLDTLLKEDSGMKEYLEKKEIAANLKPVIRILLLIDLLFLTIFLLNSFNVITFNSISLLLINIIGVSNAIALIYLQKFMINIDIVQSRKNIRFIKFIRRHNYYSILVSIVFTTVGITIAYYINNVLGELIAGLGIVIIILLLSPKKFTE